ncbi:DUF4158 domain-containing protein [Crassaminicella indica]|uniref:DUF4158 domain-containing protein n=1 Tax=Crassaminicella indica TaxID=2855394 RepID=A0ABX8RKI2_9CLOT|nr:DUF4158 domain-containing protein [Crassaminicella indica]
MINHHRRDYNKIGFALQLGMLRNLGCSLNDISDVPNSVLNYISEQLSINPIELKYYAQRENTRREHLQEIRETYGYRNFADEAYEYLLKLILPASNKRAEASNRDDY